MEFGSRRFGVRPRRTPRQKTEEEVEEEEEGEGEEGEEGGEESTRVSKELHLWLKSRDPRLAGGEQTQATRYKQFFPNA